MINIIIHSTAEDGFSMFLSDFAVSDLAIQFKLIENYQGLQFSKDTPDQ